MSVMSELKIDRDLCQHCGRVLYQHYAGKRTREVLREYDGSLCLARVVDVTCLRCGHITAIDYMAELLPAPSLHRAIAGVPTL